MLYVSLTAHCCILDWTIFTACLPLATASNKLLVLISPDNLGGGEGGEREEREGEEGEGEIVKIHSQYAILHDTSGW